MTKRPKTLHLLCSEPDDAVTRLILTMMDGDGDGDSVACLYPDTVAGAPVDWRRVLKDVFAHEKIICWW